MKKLAAVSFAVVATLAAGSANAFFGNSDKWSKPECWYDPGCNPYDEWDPRYWINEMEDMMNSDDDYPFYGPYGPMMGPYGRPPMPYGPPMGAPMPYGPPGAAPYGPPMGAPMPYGPPGVAPGVRPPAPPMPYGAPGYGPRPPAPAPAPAPRPAPRPAPQGGNR